MKQTLTYELYNEIEAFQQVNLNSRYSWKGSQKNETNPRIAPRISE